MTQVQFFLYAQETTTLNWNYASQGLPVSEIQPRPIAITALAQQPNRFAPTVLLYAGTGGAGVYRSIDSGKTWAAVNTALGNLNINMLHTSGLQLYAGTNEGLYATEDIGNSWRRVGSLANGLSSPVITCMTSGVLDNIPMLFVGTASGVYRSLDGGFTWSFFNSGLSSTQYITALQIFGRRIFAGTPNGLYSFHLDSVNAIDSLHNARWFPAETDFGPAPVTSFLVTANNRLYAGTGGAGIWFSQDGGVSWLPANRGLESSDAIRPGVNGLAINRPGLITETSRILAAATNGLYASPLTGTANWTNINTGFPILSSGAILVFNNDIFVTTGPNILRGTLYFAPPPQIFQVLPSSLPAQEGATGDTVLTLSGNNFNNPIVFFNGVPLNRLGEAATSIRVQLPRNLLIADGVKKITLVNVDGQRTEALFTVSGQVAPFIRSISPDSLTVGDPEFDLQISGRSLLDSATVTLANVPAPVTQRIGTTFLTARVPAAALAVAGRKFVRVTNPNGQFYDFPFRVRALPPRITEISPPTVSVGNDSFELTIRGFEFFTTANVEPFPLEPLIIQVGGVKLLPVRENTSREVVVLVPRSLVSSEATLTVRLTNDDGQFAETRLNVVPFGLSAITTPQTTICPGARTALTAVLTSGVPPFRIVWTNSRGGGVDSSSIDANGVIRGIIAPTEPTSYTLTVTDRDGMGVALKQSIDIGILQPQASVPQNIRFDTVNTFFRLSTTQTLRFTNTSSDGTPLTITGITSRSGSFLITSGIGQIVQAGQSLEVGVVFEPTRDGIINDTLRVEFGPCERSVSTAVQGFRITPVLPPPPLLPVATAPDGRVALGAAPPLSWLPVGFLSVPTGYVVQIARVEQLFTQGTGFSVPLFTGTVMQATTIQPAFQLQPNTAYAWTVQARNSVTSSVWSVPLYFITPPTVQQTASLAPTRLEFGNTVLSETGRRGVQITTTSQQGVRIIGADIFAPAGAPRAAFSLAEGGMSVFPPSLLATARVPANIITTFYPVDTVFHQGVLRLRTQSNDTLYALLNGNGVQCVPDMQPPGNSDPCAETELAFQFAPFKDNKPRPDPGDTITIQVVVRGSNGLNATRYTGRARQFTADIVIGNPDVLFPLDVLLPANIPQAQRSVSRTRIRLQNVPVPTASVHPGNNVVIAEFRAEALLADTLVSSLRFAEFAWTDTPGGNSAGSVNIRRVFTDTTLTVETCDVNGSPRLLRLKPTALLTSLVVAPNPVREQAEAFIHTEAATSLEILIVNTMGQTVHRQTLEAHHAGDHAVSLLTAHLAQGAYMVVVKTNHEALQRQILVLD